MRILLAVSLLFLLNVTAAIATETPTPGTGAHDPEMRQVIGDWIVACMPVAGHKSCTLSQTLASQKLGKPVSVLTIGRDRAGKLTAAVRVPVGVSLTAGLVVGLSAGSTFTIPYSACHRIGCFAPFELNEARLSEMRNAPRITARAQSISQKSLTLAFSTKGFPAAYESFLKESR